MNKAQKDFIGTAGIVAMLVVTTALTIYFGFMTHNTIEKDTLCDISVPSRSHRVIIVDKTDPLPQLSLKNLKEVILEQRDLLAVQDRIWIFVMSGDGIDLSEPLFSRCRPQSRNDVSSFNSDPARVEEQYEMDFQKPLDKVLNGLLTAGTADVSPIAETLGRVAASRSFGVTGPRHIVFITDLLQNSPMFSAYGSAWKKRPAAKDLGDQLVLDYGPVFSSIALTVLVIDRHLKDVPPQNELRTYWRNVLAAAGVPAITIRTL